MDGYHIGRIFQMSLKTELTFGCDRKALEKVSPEATDEVHYDFFCGRRPNAFSLPVRYANRRRGRVAAPKSKTQPGWGSKVGCLHYTPQTAPTKSPLGKYRKAAIGENGKTTKLLVLAFI